ACAILGCVLHGFNYFRMRMTEDGGSPRADIIHVLIFIHIPDMSAFSFIDEKRLAAHRAKRAHRRVHAAGNIAERLGEQLFGFRARHYGARCCRVKVDLSGPYSERTTMPVRTLCRSNQACLVSRTYWI